MMKFNFLIIGIIMFGLYGCSDKTKGPIKELAKPTDFKQKYSYAIGKDFGAKMRADSLKTDLEYFCLGVQHGFKGDSGLFKSEETQKIMEDFQKMLLDRQKTATQSKEKEMSAMGEQLKTEGPKFLEENKKKSGVKTTASGLQYEVITQGKGKKPEDDDIIKVQFKAFFTNGQQFDDTYKSAPDGIKLPVKGQGILPGWTEAFKMMKAGSKYKIVLPPNLALGEKGAPPVIPPNAVLIFDLELLSIEGKIPKNQMMPPQGGGNMPPPDQQPPQPQPR
jgi:FKBP-type peptidyl-prolyl cis-trans isomerase